MAAHNSEKRLGSNLARWLSVTLVALTIGTQSDVCWAKGRGERKGHEKIPQREDRVTRATPREGQYDAANSPLITGKSTYDRVIESQYDKVPWELKNPKAAKRQDELMQGWAAVQAKEQAGESLNQNDQKVIEELNDIAIARNQYESASSPLKGFFKSRRESRREKKRAKNLVQRFRDAAKAESSGDASGNRDPEVQRAHRDAQRFYYNSGQLADFRVRMWESRRGVEPTLSEKWRAHYYRKHREMWQRYYQQVAQYQQNQQRFGFGNYSVPSSQFTRQQKAQFRQQTNWQRY